jgi:hypothetical protein
LLKPPSNADIEKLARPITVNLLKEHDPLKMCNDNRATRLDDFMQIVRVFLLCEVFKIGRWLSLSCFFMIKVSR